MAEITSTVSVKGGAELMRFLRQLPEKLERNIMKGAMRAAAKPIVIYAKQLCPVSAPSWYGAKQYGHYEGALRDSIRVSQQPRSRDKATQVAMTIKVGGKVKSKKHGTADVFYAYWVEFTGAAPHLITPKKDRGNMGIHAFTRHALYFGDHFYPMVEHPGFQARPFLRPAFDAKKEDAIRAAADYIKKRLTKEGLATVKYVNVDIGDDA